MNGEMTGFKVSLKEALLNREWDIITVQQVSKVDYTKIKSYGIKSEDFIVFSLQAFA